MDKPVEGEPAVCPHCGSTIETPRHEDPHDGHRVSRPVPASITLRPRKPLRRINPMGVLAVVTGLMAAGLSWIPVINFIAMFIGGVGLLFAFSGMMSGMFSRRRGKASPILGAMVCLAAIGVATATAWHLPETALVESNAARDHAEVTNGENARSRLSPFARIRDGRFSMSRGDPNDPDGTYVVWQGRLTNTDRSGHRFEVRVSFIDGQGFELATDRIDALQLGGGKSTLVTGRSRIPRERARQIDEVVLHAVLVD